MLMKNQIVRRQDGIFKGISNCLRNYQNSAVSILEFFLGMLYLLVCNRRVGKLCKKVQGVDRLGKSQSKNIVHAYIVLFRFFNDYQIASVASCSC